MPKKSSTVSGLYQDRNIIKFEDERNSESSQLTDTVPSAIPYGTRLEVTLTYEEVDYLNGADGIVWATYHLRQAETIQAALLVQNIACELSEHALPGARLYLLRIPNASEVAAAVDFIWREPSGLRLRPDWWYPAGGENESFNKWITGT